MIQVAKYLSHPVRLQLSEDTVQVGRFLLPEFKLFQRSGMLAVSLRCGTQQSLRLLDDCDEVHTCTADRVDVPVHVGETRSSRIKI